MRVSLNWITLCYGKRWCESCAPIKLLNFPQQAVNDDSKDMRKRYLCVFQEIYGCTKRNAYINRETAVNKKI